MSKNQSFHFGIAGHSSCLNRLYAVLSLMVLLFGLAGCSTTNATPPIVASADSVGTDKTLLNRLVRELKQSSRSFIYLRSKGFALSDSEFDQIISRNDDVLQRTRIVRRDDKGVRQIPGWPGVTLKTEYKEESAKDAK